MMRSKALIRLAVALLLLAAVFQFQVPVAQSAECTDGQTKNIAGPICSCDDGIPPMSTPKDRYQCIGGVWVYQFSFCAAPFCR